jgi:MFS family permease
VQRQLRCGNGGDSRRINALLGGVDAHDVYQPGQLAKRTCSKAHIVRQVCFGYMASTMKSQIGLLAFLQGLFLTNNVTLIAINGLAGYALASNKALATLPITAYVLGSALTTLPAAQLMKKYGRAPGFRLGGAAAVVGTLVAFFGLQFQSLALLCLGTLIAGAYPAFGSSLRFAAAEVAQAAEPSFKPKAISWVLLGGIMGGIVGPEMSKLSRTALPTLFAGTYLTLSAIALLSIVFTYWLKVPQMSAAAASGPVRPLRQILAQPACWIAVLSAVIAYGVMNLLMVATPLAMDVCKHPYASAALVLEWHVIGMFAPGLFTGNLIVRFGVTRIMLIGAALMFACSLIALTGVDLMQFLAALFVLGVGWNFLFTGATTLLTTTHTPSEKAKVQGFNELCIFATMMSSSLSSGVLLNANGWAMLQWLAMPIMLFSLAAIAWFTLQPAPVQSAP